VKAAVSGLLAGLLVAAVWFALFSGVDAVRHEPAAGPLTVPTSRSERPLLSAQNAARPANDTAPHESARAEVHAQPVQLATRSQPSGLMPGFIAGPPPGAEAATAQERNRRFLDAVNSRVHGSR